MASLSVLPSHYSYGSDRDVERMLGRPVNGSRVHVVVIGAHPDDPETGCGGTIAKLTADGHRVTIVYLTRGEAGLRGSDHSATARVRTAEALAGASILGARAVFANQIDGNTSASADACSRFTHLLRSLRPDIVLTHWAQDTHADHRNAAALTRAAWDALGRSFTLVFYEVMMGLQTYNFEPNLYVDVSQTEDEKRSAIYAHVCQRPARFYPYHVDMERTRGAEANLERAEAFIVERNDRPAVIIPFPA